MRALARLAKLKNLFDFRSRMVYELAYQLPGWLPKWLQRRLG